MSYSAKISYDPARLKSRTTLRFCLLNLALSSKLLDQCLGYLSVFTGACLTTIMIGGCVALIPSMILSRLMGWPSFVNQNRILSSSSSSSSSSNTTTTTNNNNNNNKNSENISTTAIGSITAIKTLNARSQFFLQQSGGPDHLAPQLMVHMSLFGESIPGSGLFTQLFNLLMRWNFYLTGRIYVDQMAALSPLKIGEQSFLQARTCWLDDCVETFVRNHTTNAQIAENNDASVNVVILGAGFDTRCYRLNLPERGVSTFEVDAPGTQKLKKRVLARAGIDAGPTTFISCDFGNEDWLQRLLDNGFSVNKPSFFVWEGVTPYITKETVKSTLNKIATICAPGSCIGCDYVDRTWALTPKLAAITKRGGEPWLFGMTGNEPEELAEDCGGLEVWDHLHKQEIVQRYLAKHYDGRPVGYLEDDFGGLILLGKS